MCFKGLVGNWWQDLRVPSTSLVLLLISYGTIKQKQKQRMRFTSELQFTARAVRLAILQLNVVCNQNRKYDS